MFKGRVGIHGVITYILNLLSSKVAVKAMGLVALLVIIWFAGQYFGLNTVQYKLIAMSAVAAGYFLITLLMWFYYKSKGDKLASDIAMHSAISHEDLEEIRKNIQAAVERLKASFDSGISGNAALYKLPWYMIFGPSTCGKTTLLTNSELKFPHSETGTQYFNNIGGTKNCDWWFSDKAILIDTAGRYSTADKEGNTSEELADNKVWLTFLSLLKKHRKKLPINGAIVTMSVTDVLKFNKEEMFQSVKLMRDRIDELVKELGVIFPVFIVFTRMDHISGFEPFFSSLSDDDRKQVFGAYIPDKGESSEIEPVAVFKERMDELHERLCEQRFFKMTRENDLQRKALIFDFPNQFRFATQKLTEYVNLMIQPHILDELPWFAGVYFTSSTQQGLPLEYIETNGQGEFHSVASKPTSSSVTRSYFSNRLFTEAIFKLQNFTRANRKKLNRRLWLKGGFGIGMITAVGFTFAVLTMSQSQNKTIIENGDRLVAEVRKATVEKDTIPFRMLNLFNLHGHFQLLHGYEQRLPWYFALGVYEGDKTLGLIEEVVGHELKKLVIQPLINDTNDKLQEFNLRWGRASGVEQRNVFRQEYYDTLKFALSLSNRPDKLDRKFVTKYIVEYWDSVLRRGGSVAAGNSELERMENLVTFYLNSLETPGDKAGMFKLWVVNQTTIDKARQDLITIPESAPLYEQIKTSVDPRQKPVSIAQLLSIPNRRVLQSDTEVPYLFSEMGWKEYVYPEIIKVVTNSTAGDWVLGTDKSGDENVLVATEYNLLLTEIRKLYFTDYANAWLNFFNGVSVKPFDDLTQASQHMSLLANEKGPISELLSKIHKHIYLYEPSEIPKLSDSIPSNVENPDNIQVSTHILRKPVLELTELLADIHRFTTVSDDGKISDLLMQYVNVLQEAQIELSNIAASADPQKLAMDSLILLLSGAGDHVLQKSWIIVNSQLNTGKPVNKKELEKFLKSPFISMFESLARETEKYLDAEWNRQVYGLYQNNIKGKFPFDHKGTDASVEDVEELLNLQNGSLWQFNRNYLSSFIKAQPNSDWKVNTWQNLSLNFNDTALKGLKAATRVSRALFPANGSKVDIGFSIKPISSEGLHEMYFSLNGKYYRHKNGPEEYMDFTWPGRTNVSSVQLYAMDNEGYQLTFTDEIEGPWALLHFFTKGRIKWQKGGNEYIGKWKLSSQSVSKEVELQYWLRSSRNSSIFSRNTMASFRLPSALFSIRTGELGSSAVTID